METKILFFPPKILQSTGALASFGMEEKQRKNQRFKFLLIGFLK
jgi:hypothetical protein